MKDDSVRLDDAIFKKLTKTGSLSSSAFTMGEKAKDSSNYIVYNNKTGALYYDADGSGEGLRSNSPASKTRWP
ncbi:hypothetical protein [Microvirga sp. TS319]|uniref:hypothetical protein n=1 Tax=Microvirga sp. TS319 TaxID=3241165 RepID=UPI00351A80B2